MNSKITLTMLALASVGLTVSAVAATADTAAMPAHHHHHPMMMGGVGFMAALHKLNLTAEQEKSIHSIMDGARQQLKSGAENGSADFFALQNPGDPNYNQAVHNAEAAATNRIEQRSAVDQQIYNLLTPEQKAQLPQVLANMKTKAEQRHSEWQQQHSHSTSSSSQQ